MGLCHSNRLGGAAPAVVTPPVVTYADTDTDGTNLTTYTFSAMTMGSTSNVLHVVIVHAEDSNAGPGAGVSTVTIGGNSMSNAVEELGTTANEGCVSIWYWEGTLSATEDVVVTMDQGVVRCAASKYYITGYSSAAPTGSGGAQGTNNTCSDTVTCDSTMEGLVGNNGEVAGQATTFTTGVSKNVDANYGDAGAQYAAGVIDDDFGTSTTLTSTQTGSADDCVMAWAVWTGV